ncbi:MAG TPA: hypothetical protein PKH06_00910 [Candidatus Dojkabacteria bacterium]|nr:hypothetical protein [Candidatus Dojkabacteria bacterium]
MKALKYILLSFIFCFTTVLFAYATDITTRESIGFDETLSNKSDIYSLPQKIYISQLNGFSTDLNDDSQSWIKLLYYYSVTRLKLNDIPYNYLIDRSGNIYEGAQGGIGINPGLQGGDGVVLIGIMDDSTTLSPRTYSSLISFIEDLSYKYGIKKDNWDFVDLKISKKDNSLSYLTYTSSQKALRNSVLNALEEVEWSNTENLKYKGSIVSVENDKEVEIGKRLTVKVKIKNENDFTWFGGSTYIYVSTKDSADSPHAINGVWESFSKPTYIKGTYIKAGDTGEVSFELNAKSKPGTYKESYYFMKSAENTVEGSEFDVEFTIVKGNNKLIEIVSPEYGFVNIRECRWYSCAKIEVANEGDVFITTKKEEGWYEIVFNDGVKGWVYQKYAREI